MLVEIGKYAQLDVVKETDFGIYLDGGPHGEILLPLKEVPEGTAVDDELEVFIYCDSEDRIIATTLKPFATVGQFASLKVADVANVGAFLDWGIPFKHLLVPFSEQRKPLRRGERAVVYIYFDEKTERIVATTKVKKYLSTEKPAYQIGDQVTGWVVRETPLGYTILVDQSHFGLLFKNEVFKNLSIGDEITCFIKLVREDKKIDLTLHKQGKSGRLEATEIILMALQSNDGFLPLTDKSSPDRIYKELNMSKKLFKKAVGTLYRNKKILLVSNGIRLAE